MDDVETGFNPLVVGAIYEIQETAMKYTTDIRKFQSPCGRGNI